MTTLTDLVEGAVSEAGQVPALGLTHGVAVGQVRLVGRHHDRGAALFCLVGA